MPAKVSKTAKTTSPVAKSVSKVDPKTAKTSVRLTEEEKAADPENFILNPNTKNYVLKTSVIGKKLVKAKETNEEVPKTLTGTQRLILFIQTLQDQLDLEDSEIKVALKLIEQEMPRGFPSSWGGKRKTARSPDHPKQPSNPFIFYCKAIRPSVVKSNPGLKITEIMSMMGKLWADTTEEDRKEYLAQTAADKVRYETAMKIFEEAHPDQARGKSSPSGKPTKETAYHLYCEDNRESCKDEFPDLEGKDITRKLAEKWDTLKESDPAKITEYQTKANEANADFEERMTEYHNSPNTPKKWSAKEEEKSKDPNYRFNAATGRHVLKEKEKEKSPSPKTKKTADKKAATPVEKVEKVEVSDDDLVA